MLEGLALSSVNQEVLSNPPLVDENAGSHRGNAALKAIAWSRAWGGGLTIASDGGLSIPCLGRRWTSLRTHRFAGTNADNNVRRNSLLKLMQPYSGLERRVRWLELVALAEGGKILGTWRAWSDYCTLATSIDPAKPFHDFWVDSLVISTSGRKPHVVMPGATEKSQQHWNRLKPRIHAFFRGRLSPLGDQQ